MSDGEKPVKFPAAMLVSAAANVLVGTDETAGDAHLQAVADHWLAGNPEVRQFIASHESIEQDPISEVLQTTFIEGFLVGLRAAVLARTVADKMSGGAS